MSLQPYRPHPLLRSGHLQTLMVGILCGDRPPYNAQTHKIALDDGESIVVHQEATGPLAAGSPVNILIHGLGGDHSSPYMQRIAHRLAAAGQNVWRIDMRGCGAGAALAWRPPHAGRSNDIAAVVSAAARRFPHSPIQIAGFSLGGNILLKMLGEAAAGELDIPNDRIRRAIAVAPPIELDRCADRMDATRSIVYTKFYLKMLGHQVAARRSQWPQWAAVPTEPPPKTIRQFDARYTVPLSGLISTEDYYRDASAKPWLDHIATPTRVLVDLHDPVVTASSFANLRPNPNMQFTFTRRGGHMGYFGRDVTGRPIRWMEHFVQHHLTRPTG